VVRKVAEGRSVSLAQVAIGWLIARPVVSSVILGARSMSQLTDNMAAAGLTLTARSADSGTDAGEDGGGAQGQQAGEDEQAAVAAGLGHH
jgi:aryl-alcohol dehydrogenase-like predicted oxidoreductase